VTPEGVVYFVPALFLIVFLLRGFSDFLSGYAFQHIGLGVTTSIRNDLYLKVLHQSSRFHLEHQSGELVSRVVNDVSMIHNAVSQRLLDLFQQSVTLVLLFGLLLSTHLKLALICSVLAPVVLYPIVLFGRGMRRTSHVSQDRLVQVTSLLSEGVHGHRVVKAFGMEAFEHGRFLHASLQHLRVNLRAQLLSNLSSPVVASIGMLGSAGLLVYAGLSIRAGTLTTAVLVQFLANLILLYEPIQKLNKANLSLQQAIVAVQRTIALMSVPNEIEDRPGAQDVAGLAHEIRFDRLTFSYGTRPVLSGIDLAIKRGEVVAIVGPSGAGKTTLVNLLLRFMDPDEGSVSVDGKDLRDIRLASLRSSIGIVTQETILFNDTVRRNIAYGRDDIPLERVREAAAAAFADDFIMQLPEGYDTVIGESGMRLSGGQRQRLAIARALLKDAPILILDEATSHLDSASEDLVSRALFNLMRGRTTLVIAHRLSTVMKADRIVVLEGGRLVEEGSHEQLLNLGGAYRRQYDLQFRG
jgi:subfamily B ATP-binding cassette protein MsbA